MDKLNETGFADWNKKSLDELVNHLEREFMVSSTGTAKAVFELISFYRKNSQSHKHVVMQGLLSDCCQAAVITTEIHTCEKCTCSCSPTVASSAVGSQTSARTCANGCDWPNCTLDGCVDPPCDC